MNELIIGSRSFKINEESSSLYYSVENNKIVSCDIEMDFLEGNYKNEKISPIININTIPLNVEKIMDLKGIILSTKTPEESDTREDYLMLYESEPFEKLTVEIISIKENKAHIKLSGIAITDGYTKPYKKEEFKVEAMIKATSYDELKKNNQKTPLNNKHISKDTLIGNSIISMIFIAIGIYAIISGKSTMENKILAIGTILFGIVFAWLTWKPNIKKEK